MKKGLAVVALAAAVVLTITGFNSAPEYCYTCEYQWGPQGGYKCVETSGVGKDECWAAIGHSGTWECHLNLGQWCGYW